MEQKTINQNKLQALLCIIALTLGVLVSAVLFSMPSVHAEETQEKKYNYKAFYTTNDYKYEIEFSSNNPVFLAFKYKPSKYAIAYSGNTVSAYSLSDDGSKLNTLSPFCTKRYKYDKDLHDYVLDTDFTPGTITNAFNIIGGDPGYLDIDNSGLKLLYTNAKDYQAALIEYAMRGGVSITDEEVAYTLSSTKLLPISNMYSSWVSGLIVSNRVDSIKITDANISDNGILSWNTNTLPDNVISSGVSLLLCGGNNRYNLYRNNFPTNASVQLNLKQLIDDNSDCLAIWLLPYYITDNHRICFGNYKSISIDKNKDYYTSSDTVPFKYLGNWKDPVPIVTPGKDNEFTGGVTDPSGYLYPDESTTTIQGNNSIKLIDFNVDKNFKASWSGLDGIGTQTSKYSFIEFEVAFASNNSPGNVLAKKVVKERCLISKGSFQIPIEYTTFDSNSYVLYVKATPYHYNGDDPTHRLYKGSVSYKYFNNDGTPSWDYSDNTDLPSGGGGIRRGTVNLTDFLLSGVSVKDSLLGYSTITWTGTTKDNDLLFIPESDTLVIASYILTTKNGDDYKYTPVTYTTTTINAGKINVNVAKLVDEAQKSGEAWDMQIRLTPAYTSNGILYMGEQTVCHMTDKSVKNETTTPDGSIKVDDVTNNVVPGGVDGKVEITADDLAGYTNTFVSFLKGLISAMGQIPQLLGTVFSFLPDMYRNAIGILFVVILILRILGR